MSRAARARDRELRFRRGPRPPVGGIHTPAPPPAAGELAGFDLAPEDCECGAPPGVGCSEFIHEWIEHMEVCGEDVYALDLIAVPELELEPGATASVTLEIPDEDLHRPAALVIEPSEGLEELAHLVIDRIALPEDQPIGARPFRLVVWLRNSTPEGREPRHVRFTVRASRD
jgi:hypothetical protein